MFKKETNAKLNRIRQYLAAEGFNSMVLMRKDNFAWLTNGGDNTVVVPSAEGVCALVIRMDKVFLVALEADGSRISDEDLGDLEAEYVSLRWYEKSIPERAAELAGNCFVSDTVGLGTYRLSDIYELHNPFFDFELDRMREAGRITDEVMTGIALRIRRGMTDIEVQSMMLSEFVNRGFQCDVALVGTDERLFRYRHPTPCGAKIDRYVLFSPALRYKGIHCNISRCVYFGDALPEDVEKAYETVCVVEANCISRLQTGVTYASILEEHKALFNEMGFADAWRGHFPGGRTGYYVGQSGFSEDPSRIIRETDAFEWFITVPGAKCAELVVKQGDSVCVASNTGLWPSRVYHRNGINVSIPQIMLRHE